jgi:hypothetical protein
MQNLQNNVVLSIIFGVKIDIYINKLYYNIFAGLWS